MTKLYISITTLLFMVMLGCTTPGQAQSTSSDNTADANINRDNYYKHYKAGGAVPLTTNWLRRNEAVPIIVDELTKLGYRTHDYVLYELEDGSNILLDVYSRGSDLGVVFNTGHFAEVKEEQRNTRTFNQDKFKHSGSLGKREAYTNLPVNIIVLQETWYWYQYRDNKSTEGLLNKATAEQILRQDIRAAAEAFKKKSS